MLDARAELRAAADATLAGGVSFSVNVVPEPGATPGECDLWFRGRAEADPTNHELRFPANVGEVSVVFTGTGAYVPKDHVPAAWEIEDAWLHLPEIADPDGDGPDYAGGDELNSYWGWWFTLDQDNLPPWSIAEWVDEAESVIDLGETELDGLAVRRLQLTVPEEAIGGSSAETADDLVEIEVWVDDEDFIRRAAIPTGFEDRWYAVSAGPLDGEVPKPSPADSHSFDEITSEQLEKAELEGLPDTPAGPCAPDMRCLDILTPDGVRGYLAWPSGAEAVGVTFWDASDEFTCAEIKLDNYAWSFPLDRTDQLTAVGISDGDESLVVGLVRVDDPTTLLSLSIDPADVAREGEGSFVQLGDGSPRFGFIGRTTCEIGCEAAAQVQIGDSDAATTVEVVDLNDLEGASAALVIGG